MKTQSPRNEFLSAFAGMRKDAEELIDVLGLNHIDLPGFSAGAILV
jgi:hypothetical protein